MNRTLGAMLLLGCVAAPRLAQAQQPHVFQETLTQYVARYVATNGDYNCAGGEAAGKYLDALKVELAAARKDLERRASSIPAVRKRISEAHDAYLAAMTRLAVVAKDLQAAQFDEGFLDEGSMYHSVPLFHEARALWPLLRSYRAFLDGAGPDFNLMRSLFGDGPVGGQGSTGDGAFTAFYVTFRDAVAREDVQAVLKSVRFPLEGDPGKAMTKARMTRDFRKVFDDVVKTTFALTGADSLSYRAGRYTLTVQYAYYADPTDPASKTESSVMFVFWNDGSGFKLRGYWIAG